MITVRPLQAEDRAAWGELAAGYKAFYNTPTTAAEYDEAWRRLLAHDSVHGLAALDDGQVVGIVHYLFHPSVWAPRGCYLQDLFTAAQRRGRGVARALIGAVADAARAQGATRLYWLTQETNHTARALYDRVAQFKGFIRYDHPLA